MKKNTQIISFTVFILAVFFLPAVVSANPATVTISPNIPGVSSVSQSDPCGWIVSFYTFAMLFSGILAFGAIVLGGFYYATSAGNPSRQGKGREFITSALLGLLLLAGAYVILYTIDHGLTSCSLPNLASVGGTGTGVGSGAGGAAGCASGQCSVIPSSYCTQTAQTTGVGAINCNAAPAMITSLNCIHQKDSNFKVSEGYPPTVTHTSGCHSNGCCVDTQIVSGNCSDVQNLISAAQQCGVPASNILNEYPNCGGKTYGTTTGYNVHIQAPPGGGC